MASKLSVQLKRDAVHVASSARSLADKVGATATAKLLPLVREGETMPDLTFFQELLGRYLDQRGQLMGEIDQKYAEEQRLRRGLRLERQRLEEQLVGTLRVVRYQLDRRLGKDSVVHIKDRNFSRRGAASLIQLAREAATALRDPAVAWEQTGAQGGGESSAFLAETLEAEAKQLELLAEDKAGQQLRLVQTGLEEKLTEIETTVLTVRSASNLLAGLYGFADLPFHASRVRRRVPRKAAMEEEETEGMETGGMTNTPAAAP